MEQNAKLAMDPEAKKWLGHIAAYDKKFEKWLKRAEEIERRYRDFDDQDGAKRMNSDFNILWSNVQVLLPAVFSRLPKPDVSRRFRDNDPVGRVASLLLERALSYEIEHYPDYRAAMTNSVLDRFLGGRGTSWVRYEPHFTAMQDQSGLQVTDDADEANGEQEQNEQIAYECSPVDYVHYKDFGHMPTARTWEENTGVWRRVFLNREKCTERFGKAVADKLSYDSAPDGMDGKQQRSEAASQEPMACIYEIWCKTSGEALWVAKNGILCDKRADPLELENFWPCPRPLYATMTNTNLIPVPDFKMYQNQAKQLDKLSARIDGLIEMLKVRGVYDAAVPELARLFKEGANGDLVPVANFAAFAEKSGLAGSIDIMDLTPIFNALKAAYEAEEQAKQQVYELMGISDITRGASDPGETYGAQKLKGQYGNMRLRNKQDEVVSFATDLLKIKAEIICNHFQPQTLLRIAAADQLMPEDQQLLPQALQLLMGERAMNPDAESHGQALSCFRVEVSSDSMVQMDEAQEKQDGLEFVSTVSSFLREAVPAVQQAPQIAPVAVALLKFGITRFKVGKTLEGMIDQALDQMVKQASQPQPEKPDPETVKIQAKMQLEDKKLQNALQLGQTKTQADAALQANEQQQQAQQNAHQNQLESIRAEQQAELDARLEQQRMQFDAQLQANEQMFMRWKEELQAAVKIEVANISSKSKLQDAATDTATNEIANEVRQ